MDFDLSDDQKLLQDTVRQFLERECPIGRVRELFDAEDAHDPALWRNMIEIGLGGIALRDEYGGAGLELLELALVAETLGRGAAPAPFLGHALAGLALQLAGSDAQRKTWLPRLALGEALGTIALAEPGDAWQPQEWNLPASGSALSGSKRHVPSASLADLIVVGLEGGRFGLVERGAPGLQIAPLEGVDRTRRLEEVHFEGTPFELLPGGPAEATRVRDAGLVLLAADAFGGASRCLEMAVEHANTREQFGVTIGHFQALKHQLANMACEIEPARSLYWYAAHAFDRIPAESERAAALAKSHLTDRFLQIARDTVEAHGGIGFTWECEVQIYFKRAMFDRAFLGTPAAHRERAAALAGW